MILKKASIYWIDCVAFLFSYGHLCINYSLRGTADAEFKVPPPFPFPLSLVENLELLTIIPLNPEVHQT